MLVSRSIWAAASTALLAASLSAAQTSTSCNPTETTCDPDEALGMEVDVDFTQGEVNSFTASGGTPTYGSDGVTMTITEEGDAPQLNSVFYIMFGKVEITMKCANGTGIVSSVVLQSDDLDEIDMEMLGVANEEMQTMYFGKGERASDAEVTVTTPDNQADFVTYTVDWTADRIIWSVAGSQVRLLEYADADGYYPQTPMQLKVGVWAGGDPSNAEGTISWAGGETDYSDGPFSMVVQSLVVTDYSTGTEYKYGNESGLWQSIESVGGEINANADDAATVTSISGASSTGTSDFPASGIAGATATSTIEVSSIPSGWHMTSEGKIVPNGGATTISAPHTALLCGPLSFLILTALFGRW
ncbi:family 16 glycoside hydrolase [Cryphonectria parasitica EP155]|uniref:Crh-like protein n=1 Tax=Cryphonectria parasitica (strain ATCC 38755 / EP155) TaxID=660469 RepID=A0A9P4YA42_CRYP1|nr:family 16 glycoside hydrolase [Cryphonectria parasitica EP155]KAF3769107.1 family 16 glycoside hydrolase [Cryphonectria parasitica EP155]